jgi:hypothetical protein
MIKVPVLSPDGKPLMPTKPSRARRWMRDGLAVGKWSDLGVFYVQTNRSTLPILAVTHGRVQLN